jgi:hypothetical protein
MAREEIKESVKMIKTYCDLCKEHSEECDSILIGKFSCPSGNSLGVAYGRKGNCEYDECDVIEHVCQVCQCDIDRFLGGLCK